MFESDPLIGSRIGNYVVVELLAKGGMGAIYLGQHPEIGRQVAIKVLFFSLCREPGFAERFVAEAKVLARLEHPNIVQIFDFGRTEEGQLYYVMELLRGGDLADYLTELGTLAPLAAWPIVEQVCSALQAAHDHGIIHRDLKLENMYIQRREPLVLKLLDFGIAKMLGSHHQQSCWRTSTGIVIGTPVFMSPEQAAGKADQIGVYTDVYALGVMLYLLLTGEPPFAAETAPELLVKHMHDPPPVLVSADPSLPVEIADLARRCLAKDPADRPPSAASVAHTYAQVLGLETNDPVLLDNMPRMLEDPGPRPLGRTGIRSPTPRKIPRQKVKSTSTLSASVGEFGPIDSVPQRRLGRWVALGAIVGILAGGALLLHHELSLREAAEGPRSARRAAAKRRVHRAAAKRVVASPLPSDDRGAASSAAAADAGGGPEADSPEAAGGGQETHTILVELAEGDRTGRCEYAIEGGPASSTSTPCKLQVPPGAEIDLKVFSGDEIPFARTWVVENDEQVALARAAGRLVPADSASKPLTASAKQARAAKPRDTRHRRTRKRRPPRRKGGSGGVTAHKPDPSDKPLSQPDKPEKPTPPKKVGAGTMDF